MKYEINSVREMKSAVFDAFEQGVVLDRGNLACFEAFDAGIDAYCETFRYGASPNAIPAARTRRAWFNELRVHLGFDLAREGLPVLLAQQLQELAAVKASFDYSVFAGAKGSLIGPDSHTSASA